MFRSVIDDFQSSFDIDGQWKQHSACSESKDRQAFNCNHHTDVEHELDKNRNQISNRVLKIEGHPLVNSQKNTQK